MKKIFLSLVLFLILSTQVLAQSKEIHDFEPTCPEVYAAYAKAAIEEFYKVKSPDAEHHLNKINFSKPLIITANTKDEFDNNIYVVGVAFPDISMKECWDFVLLEVDDGLVTSISHRASAVSQDMSRDLYIEAKRQFLLGYRTYATSSKTS